MESCRTCAKRTCRDDVAEWVDLFNTIHSQSKMETIRIEIESWKLQIKQNDGLPQKICPSCFKKFRLLINFRRRCQKAQFLLKGIFENSDYGSKIDIVVSSESYNEFNELTVEESRNEVSLELVDSNNILNDFELQTYIHKRTALLDDFGDRGNSIDGQDVTSELQKTQTSGYSETVEVLGEDVAQYFAGCVGSSEAGEVESTRSEDIAYPATSEDIIYTCLALDGDSEAKKAPLEEVLPASFVVSEAGDKSSSRMEVLSSAFECKYCYTARYGVGDDYGTEEGLLEHIAQCHDSINPYDCPGCDEKFPDAPSRTVHMKNVHVQKLYQCAACDKKYANRFNLRHHIEKYHSDSVFDCLICGKKFPSQKSLKYHSRWHTPDTQFKCSSCDRIFITERQLTAHEATHAGVRHSEYCTFCGKSFLHIKTLRWHIYRNHGGEKPFKCTLCAEVFESYKLKRVHMLERHAENLTSKEKSQCIICKKNCANEIDLIEHMQKNHEDNVIPIVNDKRILQTKKERQFKGVFQCDECPQRFNLKSALSRHSAVHNAEGRPHSCGECKKRFKRLADLNWHMKTHSGEKPNVCDVCGKAFTLKYVLTQHRKSHEALEKSFQCLTCGRGYLFEKSLRLHERVHTGKTFYACDLCDESFVTHIKFLYHMRKQHGEQEEDEQ